MVRRRARSALLCLLNLPLCLLIQLFGPPFQMARAERLLPTALAHGFQERLADDLINAILLAEPGRP